MASSEQTSSRSGLGWLPKLILWTVVIAFGYLYLSSIDREGGQSSSLLESVAALSPIPISALPGMSTEDEAAATSPEAAQTREKVAESTDTEPVSDAESAVFAKSLITQSPAPEQAVDQQPAAHGATAATAEQKAPVAAPRQQVVIAQPAPYPAPASPTKSQAQLQPTPPARQAEEAQAARQSLSTQQQMGSAQADAQSDVSAIPGHAATGDWRAMQQQHEQMLAHYAAMRREADERMREYWARMRSAAPTAAPYDYPAQGAGYGPGYAPSYTPGAYGPPR